MTPHSIEAYAQECERLEKFATKGPWREDDCIMHVADSMDREYFCWAAGEEAQGEQQEKDADFIASARTSEPFWRTLALKYRGALKTIVGNIKYRDSWNEERKLIQAELVIKSASDLAEKVLALTRADIEKELGMKNEK